MNNQLRETAFQFEIFDRRTLSIINFFIFIFVFSTGLILFIQFHIGDGAYREEWLGFENFFWLFIHQITAIAFVVGFALHLLTYRKYIGNVMKRWRNNLPKKTRSKTREQILLFIISIVVMWAGFYPWITMPGATLKVDAYHSWIDVHNRIGLFLLIGLFIHIARRWRRIFRIKKMRKNQ